MKVYILSTSDNENGVYICGAYEDKNNAVEMFLQECVAYNSDDGHCENKDAGILNKLAYSLINIDNICTDPIMINGIDDDYIVYVNNKRLFVKDPPEGNILNFHVTQAKKTNNWYKITLECYTTKEKW